MVRLNPTKLSGEALPVPVLTGTDIRLSIPDFREPVRETWSRARLCLGGELLLTSPNRVAIDWPTNILLGNGKLVRSIRGL